MNTKKLQYITEIFAEQINHWTLFPVFLTVTGMASAMKYDIEDSPNVLMWVLCGLFPLVFFILREKVENLHFLAFFLLHLAAGALSFLFPWRNMLERTLAVFIAACYVIHSFSKLFKESDNMTEPFSPIISVIVSAVSISLWNYQGESNWDTVYVEVLVGVLALYVIDKYIRNYLTFLTLNERSAGTIPASDMFRSGIGLVSGYSLLTAGLLLLAGGGGWVTSLREGLHSLLLWVAKWFFYVLSLFASPDEPLESIVKATQETVISDGFVNSLPETAESFRLGWIWDVALTVILMVLWLFIIYKGTFALIELLRGRISEIAELKAKAVSADEGIDVREKCGIEKSWRGKGKKSSALFLSPYERVRKLYKNKVIACAPELIGATDEVKSEMLGFFTARECADKMQLSPLADIYERTRYSGQETTKENVRQMKIVCGHSSHGL